MAHLSKAHFIFAALSILFSTHLHAADPTSDPIRIAVLASLSDDWASMSQSTVKGVELAKEELEAGGGINGRKIEILVEDTLEAHSGAKAVSAYQSLRQRGIRFFIGPFGTPAGLALAPLVRKDPKVVMISATIGVREFSDSGSNLFNARGIDDAASRKTARIAFDQGLRKAAIIASQQPWESAQGSAFRDEFKSLGGTVVSYQEPLSDASDLRATVTRALSFKPDMVFLSNYSRIALTSRELTAQGYTGPRYTTIVDFSVVKEAQGTLQSAVFSSFASPNETFVEKYQKRFKEKPNFGADSAYDSMLAFGYAMREAGTDADKIKTSLLKTKFAGSGGEFSFAADRIAQRELNSFEIQGAEFKKLAH